MSKNIDLTKMPDTFCMCNVNGCPQAERCLRQTVYDAFEGEYAFIRTVNQKWFDRQKGTCKHFLSNEKLRLPRGFIRTINLIPTGKIGQFRTTAMSKLGFRRYYQARKGGSAADSGRSKGNRGTGQEMRRRAGRILRRIRRNVSVEITEQSERGCVKMKPFVFLGTPS